MKGLTVVVSLCLMIGLCGMASAQGITDPASDNIGAIDLLSARAEIYDRLSPDGNQKLLKLTIETSPTLPGAVIFEADVDGSDGTGGTISQLGAPVPPCGEPGPPPVFTCGCKCVAGMDIAISVYNRQQSDTSGSAFCASCSDDDGPCERRREAGEWYALTSLKGEPSRALGVIRGYTDPASNGIDGTSMSYTLPYQLIVAYASGNIAPDNPKKFNWAKSQDPVTNAKWQIGVWHDPTDFSDGDDIVTIDGSDITFDVSDWAPNGNDTKADVEAADQYTYCEGNFDGDQDVDGTDAAKFKENFGRDPNRVTPSSPCGKATAWW